MENASIVAKMRRALWQEQLQRFSGLWHRRFSVSQARSRVQMVEEPIEEELLPGDRLKYFHPTRPGEVLDERFKTITKLGYGSGSTVWLAENMEL